MENNLLSSVKRTYSVTVHGELIEVTVDGYSPALIGRASGPPGDCYPSEAEEIDWYANTGNLLLDNYIDNDVIARELIKKQLSRYIHNLFEEYEFDRAESLEDMKR